MRNEEQKLLYSLRNGDNHAYKYIYDHHYLVLCKIAYGFLNDQFLAESVVDDVIINLYEKRESLEIVSSLRSYLIRSVRNRCLDHLNSERERREVRFSTLNTPDEWLYSLPGTEEYPLATLLEKELENEIQRAVEDLPPESRTVFKMSRFEEKKYEEIATELNISVNTVKYHMKTALAGLHTRLKKYLLLFFY